MKKIFLTVFSIILIIWIIFIFLNLNNFKPRDYGAYEILEVFNQKVNLIGKKIQVIGVPGCTFFNTEYFNYFFLYLNNPNNQFQGIYINFNQSYGIKNNLLTNDIYYSYQGPYVLIQKESNCRKIINEVAIIKDKNRVVIEGILEKNKENKLILQII